MTGRLNRSVTRPGLGLRSESRLDLRLVPAALAAWLAALWALRVPPPVAAGATALLGGCGLLLALRRRAGRTPTIAAALLCGSAAALAAGLRVAAIDTGPLPDLAAREASAEVEMVVTHDPRPRRSTPPSGIRDPTAVVVRARAEAVELRGTRTRTRTPVVVLARGPRWMSLGPGQRVAAAAHLRPARRGHDVAAILLARGPPRLLAPAPAVEQGASRLRAGLREAAAVLPDDEGGLLPGLVVGDTSGISTELREDFRATGLAHLLAVSGANVAILLGAVLLVARWSGLGGFGSAVVGVAALAGFVLLARPEPSVLRAAAMGLVAIVALARGSPRHGLPALCAAALALVFIDPWLARSYGFALSVVATAGILVLAPGWARRLSAAMPRPLAQAVAVPASAQVVCAPIVVMFSGEVSIVAIPANLLVAPAVAPATVLGVVVAAAAPLAMPLAQALAWLAGLPTGWIVEVAVRGAQVPAATIPWPDGLAGAGLLAAITVAAALVWALAARFLRACSGALGAPAGVRRRGRWTVRPAVLAVALGATVAVVVAVAVVRPLTEPRWPPRDWVLVACDVGQGDALALAAGKATAVVVDAGPEPQAVDRCLRDLGVQRVPLVVLTHFHADHVDGLTGLLRRRGVGEVQVSPLDQPAEQAQRVAEWARRAGVPITQAVAGERREFGPLRWHVLWPERIIVGEGSAANNASVVILAENAGIRMLLTGDVEPPAQRGLIRSGADLDVEVYKIPHHGSPNQEPGLWRAASPRVALVSVGSANPYGHPAAPSIRPLAEAGVRVLRTDRQGDLGVAGEHDRLRVVSRSGPVRGHDPSHDAGATAVPGVVPWNAGSRWATRTSTRTSPGRWRRSRWWWVPRSFSSTALSPRSSPPPATTTRRPMCGASTVGRWPRACSPRLSARRFSARAPSWSFGLPKT